jgi:phosphoesterase RecJ-like protein
MRLMNVSDAASWLKARDNFIVLTHHRPDGDTLGSAAALAQGLRDAGKTAYLLPNLETTARYVPYVEPYYAPEGFAPDFVVAVDVASKNMLPINARLYANNVSLGLDHHPSNHDYGENLVLDSSRAACGEIVYDVLIALNGQIDIATATLLYIAVATDTGCFSFGNTNANAFRVAGLLAQAGAPVEALNRKLFLTKSRGRVAIEGAIITATEFFYDGRAAVVIVTDEMMDAAGATENEMDNIANIALYVEGVEIAITIREMKIRREFKVSARSLPSFSARTLCERFGGGGHEMAAGFARRDPPESIRDQVVSAIGDMLPGLTDA